MIQEKMKLFVIALGVALCFLGCSDYAQNIEDNYQEWLKAQASSSSVEYGSITYGGQTYKTVVIGTQTWMAENLNYAVDGSLCYDNAVSNCNLYGRLYTWATVMGVASTYNSAILGDSVNHQGICPSGWHVPRSSEWATLENAVGGSSTAGTYLKATSGWTSYSGISNLDSYGFSALPGGDYHGSDFSLVGYFGYWWTATEYSSTDAYGRGMGYYYTNVGTDSDSKAYGRSLRCLKDSSLVIKSSSSSTPLSSSVVKSSSSSVGVSSSSIGVCTNTYGTNTVTDCRDNQTYKTAVIGTQTWMAENLNYADSVAMMNLKGNSWCYNNSADSCTKYGRLYIWTAAMNIASSYQSASAAAVIFTPQQGVCPTGWHIPTNAEWTTLEDAVGGEDVAGTALKSTSGWNSNGNGTDAYGFSALPAGGRSGGLFFNAGNFVNFWSATESNGSGASLWVLYYSYGDFYGSNDIIKNNGFSVRCLKD